MLMNFSFDELDWIRHSLAAMLEEYEETKIYDAIKPIFDKVNEELHYQES